VKRVYDGLLIVGGGITTPETARKAARAGADVLVIGNLLQSAGFEKSLRQIVTSIRP
jgi:phosphoglycerol geranylgeranyltransferase